MNDGQTPKQSLTPRETDIAKLVAMGYSNKRIAAELAIAYSTVKNHLSSILRKLKLEHRTQLALYMRETGGADHRA